MGLPLTLLLLSTGPSPEAAKPEMLVLEVQATPEVSRATAKLLGELLLADVHASRRYRAIGVADMLTALSVDERKQVVDCEADSGCLAEIGAAYGAALVLEASVGVLGASHVLTLKLIDTTKLRVVSRDVETVHSEDELAAALHRLAAHVLDLRLEPHVPPQGTAVRGGWWASGGGALLLVSGAVFGGMAAHDLSAFRASPWNDRLGDSADVKAAVADGFFIVGGALLSAGIIWLLVGGAE